MSPEDLEALLELDDTVALAGIARAIQAELTRRAGYALRFGIHAPRRRRLEPGLGPAIRATKKRAA